MKICILLMTLGMAASAADRVLPITHTAGVIVNGKMSAVVMAPPFLTCYASENLPQAIAFASKIDAGATFDYDVSSGYLYLLGSKEDIPPDDRPDVYCHMIPAGLMSTVTSTSHMGYRNGRILHSLQFDGLATPGLIDWIPVAAVPQGKGWGVGTAMSINSEGALILGVASHTEARMVRREMNSATFAAVNPLADFGRVDFGYVPVGQPILIREPHPRLLRIGGDVMVLCADGVATYLTTTPAGSATTVPVSGLQDADVIVDKDAGCSWLLDGATASALAGLLPANDSIRQRHAALLRKTQEAIAQMQAALEYRVKAKTE